MNPLANALAVDQRPHLLQIGLIGGIAGAAGAVGGGERPGDVERRDLGGGGGGRVAQDEAGGGRHRLRVLGPGRAAAGVDLILLAVATGSQIARTRAAIQEAAIEMEARRFEWEWVSSTWIRPEEYETYEWFELPLLVDDARRRYEDATRAFWATEARLEELQRGPHSGDIRAAEAEVSATGAEAGARQAELALAESAPRTEEIAVAEAAVERALASLARTRLNRQQAELIAPFGGTVSRVLVQPAQYVAPGEAVAQIADLSHLRVETTDLSEIDVAGIAVGDPATVTFDALPGVTVQGTVTHISPRAEEGTGVNFTVRIELDEIPPAVRWGMTAFVDIPLE